MSQCLNCQRVMRLETWMRLQISRERKKSRPPLWIMYKYLRAGPSEMLLPRWYNCGTNYFLQADFCLAEMKKPTVLSNISCITWSGATNQIFENKILGTGFWTLVLHNK